MTKKGSKVEIVDLFFKIYNRNGTLLMKELKSIAKKKSEVTIMSEEQPTRWRVSLDFSSQPHRPR